MREAHNLVMCLVASRTGVPRAYRALSFQHRHTVAARCSFVHRGGCLPTGRRSFSVVAAAAQTPGNNNNKPPSVVASTTGPPPRSSLLGGGATEATPSAAETTERAELAALRADLRRHDDLYYNRAEPELTDAEYDALRARALALERRLAWSSSTAASGEADEDLSRTVGAKRSGAFAAAPPHLTRMLSLENLKRKGDESDGATVARWLDKTRKAARSTVVHAIVAEPKLDGLSVALRYDVTGRLKHAATRGDGRQGDDVTANALTVARGVPERIDFSTDVSGGRGFEPTELEVRGEVLMSEAAFAALQSASKRQNDEGASTPAAADDSQAAADEQQQQQQQQQPGGAASAASSNSFANARNAAAGSLRQHDPAVTASRNLSFVAFDVVTADDDDASPGTLARLSYWEKRMQLAKWGFRVAEPVARVALPVDPRVLRDRDARDAAYATAGDKLAAFHARVGDTRSELEFGIDGVVYKVDSDEARRACGANSRAPRWAAAHKFDADSRNVAATPLLDVTIGVGRRGSFHPVAKLEPVSVGLVTVQTASLHNAPHVREVLAGVRRGDEVLVRRAGAVIPQVLGKAPTASDPVVATPPFHEVDDLAGRATAAHQGPPADRAVAAADETDAPPRRPPVGERAGDFDAFTYPATCPSCGTPTVGGERTPDERYCPAAFACPAQATQRLDHFFSRPALDLKARVGKRKLEQLIAERVIQTPADLLVLGSGDVAAIAALEGWGRKSAAALVDAIDQRRRRPVALATFVYALGCPQIGATAAAKLAKAAGSWADLWAAFGAADDDDAARADRERIGATKGIGPFAVDALRAFATDPVDRAHAEKAASLLTVLDDTSNDDAAARSKRR